MNPADVPPGTTSVPGVVALAEKHLRGRWLEAFSHSREIALREYVASLSTMNRVAHNVFGMNSDAYDSEIVKARATHILVLMQEFNRLYLEQESHDRAQSERGAEGGAGAPEGEIP